MPLHVPLRTPSKPMWSSASIHPHLFSIIKSLPVVWETLMKGPWFTYAHTEIGGGVSFALLNKGMKIRSASFSSRSTRVFERSSHSPGGVIELMKRGPREREARYLQFTLQSLRDLIHIPHPLAHAVLSLGTGSPTILSG